MQLRRVCQSLTSTVNIEIVLVVRGNVAYCSAGFEWASATRLNNLNEPDFLSAPVVIDSYHTLDPV